jgi:hypothetical protein
MQQGVPNILIVQSILLVVIKHFMDSWIVVAEWLLLLLRVQKALGSNLGPETGYPDRGFSWFSSVPILSFDAI